MGGVYGIAVERSHQQACGTDGGCREGDSVLLTGTALGLVRLHPLICTVPYSSEMCVSTQGTGYGERACEGNAQASSIHPYARDQQGVALQVATKTTAFLSANPINNTNAFTKRSENG